MAKAVLLMDMPEHCGDCQFCDVDCGKGMCSIEDRSARLLGRRPGWCPLIPEPERFICNTANEYVDIGSWYKGFNACIDELEGK